MPIQRDPTKLIVNVPVYHEDSFYGFRVTGARDEITALAVAGVDRVYAVRELQLCAQILEDDSEPQVQLVV